MKRKVEVCFSPAIFATQHRDDQVVVVVDIFRASSAICYAFANGVQEIIPIEDVEEARRYKEDGYLVACERKGIKADFADFDIGPENFTPDVVLGKTLIYSTANGTKTIQKAALCKRVVIGSYLNLTALANWLVRQDSDVIILCSGWKNRFCLEDSVFAGALVEQLLRTDRFTTECDSALASLDLWAMAEKDLLGYIEKASQRGRLRNYKMDSSIKLCHTLDLAKIIPVLKSGKLVVESYI